MARQLQVTDPNQGTVMLVEDAGPGAIKAEISVGVMIGGGDLSDWPRVRLSRGDVRSLMAFLEALGDD